VRAWIATLGTRCSGGRHADRLGLVPAGGGHPVRRAEGGLLPDAAGAVAAAASGDTILIAPGTFAGGITITKSLALVGAGAGQTVIRGGGRG
jgi:hypothetical protein